jgi:phosphoglycolate phosphatase
VIRAAVFDLDGTLIDSTDAIVESYFHAYDTLGVVRPERAQIIKSIGIPLADQFRLLGGVEVDVAVEVYRDRYKDLSLEKTTLLPGVEEGLHTISNQGISVGFATSKRRYAAEPLLEHLGVLSHFAARIGPEDVARPKPDPEAVFQALEQLDVKPDQAVFVGDTEFDVGAGLAANVRTLCVTTGYATRDELVAAGATEIFDTFSEVTEKIINSVN